MKTIKEKMLGLMSAIMLSCDQAGLLISKKQHQPLNRIESIKLSLHLMACKFCRIYKIEIEDLHKDLKYLNKCSIEGCSHHVLSETQKIKLSSELEKQTVK